MAEKEAPDAPERIARRLARAGVASRRVAETMIAAGRVAVNGQVIATPALTVTAADRVSVDGKPLAAPEPARLWRYYKPLGLVTTERDEKGRDTVFAHLPAELPRVVSVGRLDLNSEGLLLLTNDGALKRRLELPSTGWLRKYRVRARGTPDDARLEPLRRGITVDGERFQPMRVDIDRQQGANVWLTVALREGKNREVRRALEAVGLDGQPADPGVLRPLPARRPRARARSRRSARRRSGSSSGRSRQGKGVRHANVARARRPATRRNDAVFRACVPASANESGASDLELARALAAVAAVDQLVLDRLVVLQALQAGGLDGGDVDEDVLATVSGLDEAVALLGVEPLDGALSHAGQPFGHRHPDSARASAMAGRAPGQLAEAASGGGPAVLYLPRIAP